MSAFFCLNDSTTFSMTLMEFKKSNTGNLFEYLHVSVAAMVNPSDQTSRSIISSDRFRYTLSLAKFLSEDLESYLLVRDFPLLSGLPFFRLIEPVKWQYELIADDSNGLGIDNGFVESSSLAQLCVAKDLLALGQLPEDGFGDSVSTVSFFALMERRETRLAEFLKQDVPGRVQDFLRHGELFIHITIAKEQNYYDAVLIKSPDDIEDRLYSFQNVIDSNN